MEETKKTFSQQLIEAAVHKIDRQHKAKQQYQETITTRTQKVDSSQFVQKTAQSPQRETVRMSSPARAESPFQEGRRKRTRVFGLKQLDRDIFPVTNYCRRDFYIEPREIPKLADIKINLYERKLHKCERRLNPVLKQIGEYEYEVRWE